ncbi:MAG: hypothetical protein GX028_06615 [Clostridiaceae bacterium]|nr:hypothetical protein [Clostridiaceae bacterium]
MQSGYQNFRAALYIRALEIAPLRDDIGPMTDRISQMLKYVSFGKVYLEIHRDMVIPERKTLLALKAWLRERGIESAAGITVTIDELSDFKTYCYSDDFYRNKLRNLVEMGAELFDEILFDDFFFNNCKCKKCIAAKGDRSWSDFRLDLMYAASVELVIKPAKAVNPNVEVVIKYPNWYEHFQGLGFDLQRQPALYDGLYAGNETRDAYHGAQHLQPYESYLVYRYYNNIKPGAVRGGWVDPFGTVTLDRYAEQLWLTLLAKAPEATLFDYHSLQKPITTKQRGHWQNQMCSFSFDGATAAVRTADGSFSAEANHAVAAGRAFAIMDEFLDLLGEPLGIKMYKPYNSRGEDFLVNYLGMIGLPMDLVPVFPEDAGIVVLAESAAYDQDLIVKIKKLLLAGGRVVITSGLLGVLQNRGIDDIVELRLTDRKILAHDFQMGWDNTVYSSEEPFIVPVIEYFTNDSWEVISCNCGAAGAPLLHSAEYADGKIFVMTIPDNPADLYKLPAEVLGKIADTIACDMPVWLEAPAQISLFVYDNSTVVIHSFRDEPADIKLVFDDSFSELEDLNPEKTQKSDFFTWLEPKREIERSGVLIIKPQTNVLGEPTDRKAAAITVMPHSFKILRLKH